MRCTIEKGVTTKRTVGFTTTTTTFADVVSAMNNRAVSYEVTMVDKYLNRSAVATAGMVKIEHKGDLAKDNWTIATKGLTADPIVSGGQSMDDPEPIKQDPAALAIDGDRTTVYTAKMDAAAIIEIDFHEKQVVTGMRYSAGGRTPVGLTRISVRQNGNWLQVAEAELDGDKTVWFSNGDGRYVSTYETDALQLALVSGQSGSVSVAEVDVLGPTGDNVDFTAVGYLAEAFQYGETDDDFIPAGSLVFTGTYAGNAAYNTVLLYDQDGQIVTGAAGDGSRMAYQTIYADVPDGEDITDVRDGVWIYWIDPGDLTTGFVMPQKVRVELYRVNDAHTNEGERLVSDSLLTDVPAEPGKITLSADGAVQAPRA